MSKEIELNLERPEELYLITKALASQIRIDIIKLLNNNTLNVIEISERLNIPASTAGVNVRILEEAGLIHTELQPGTRGAAKVCSRRWDKVRIILEKPVSFSDRSYYINMPIGNYVDCHVSPTCGLVGVTGYIEEEDNPKVFFSPSRVNAQLLWFYKGYVEYRFPNAVLKNEKAKYVEFSFEICSEAPNYKNNWPSDITVWINGSECGTWTSPGDFGDRRGRLNPDWWPTGVTQYGMLKTWRVSKEGSFIDQTKVSDVDIDTINLEKNDYITLRIGIKEDAKNVGGVNLFGEKYGDYAQNIVMRIDY